jgi:hypothetical protein
MKKTAQSFKSYFETYYLNSKQDGSQRAVDEFFADFVKYMPIKLELLASYVNTGHIDSFYQNLLDLKYLVEFSDDINRYWYLLRAYSGALSKLKANQSVKGSKKLYSYYFDKYGDRRILRNEHWFEKKRWEFLDELQLIYREDELLDFINKYELILSENLHTYTTFIKSLIENLQMLLISDKPETNG